VLFAVYSPVLLSPLEPAADAERNIDVGNAIGVFKLVR
jgi:hypothetical protein